LELFGFWVPGAPFLENEDAVPLSGDSQLAERAAGPVSGELAQCALDPAWRYPGTRELAGGAKKNQILKGETVGVSGAAVEDEKPCPGLGSNLRLGQTQEPGDVAGGIGLHELQM
jgi:hypothetical protein